MLSSILIAVTIACFATTITTIISVIMCLNLRRRRKARKVADEESTLADFPTRVRKLTVDRGNVVTAPSSPGMMSLTRFGIGRYPSCMYPASTKRNSSATAVHEPASSFPYSKKDIDFSTPTSPRSPMSSVSPTSTRGPGARSGTDRPGTYVPMPEQAWLESISALCHPQGATSEAERIFQGKRAAREAKIPAPGLELAISRPEAALTNDQVSINGQRKASLGAISQAVSEISQSGSSSPRVSVESFSQRQQRARPASRSKPSSSPLIEVNIPTPTVSAINTPRSSIMTQKSVEETDDRPRKARPPPIAITTSKQPPKVPETFLKGSGDSIATFTTSIPEDREVTDSLRISTKYATRPPRDTRQSMLSFTSSQYSPTFSIKPVDQVQIMQPVRAQQVVARGAASPAQGSQQTPTSAATPKPIFPANYSTLEGSKYQTSIDSRMVPTTPQSVLSAALHASGLKELPTPPPLPSPKSDTYEAPLTSASISFPPNLPDFSFSPTDGTVAEKQEKLAQRPSYRMRQASELQATQSPTSPRLRSSRSATAMRRKDVELSRSTTVTVAELPGQDAAASRISVHSTATVLLSELASVGDMEKVRSRVAVPWQHSS